MRSTHRETTLGSEPAGRRSRPRSPGRPRRRAFLVGSFVVLAAVALYTAWVADTVSSVRDDLVLGRSAIERGRNQLLDGDAEGAAASFREGKASFARAEDGANGLAVRTVGWVPIVGRTADAVRAVATSATTATDAVIVLADAVAALPGGPAGLAPTSGTFPIERIEPLAQAARRADALMTDAVSRLEEAPDSLLLGPVGRELRDAQAELVDARDGVHAAALLLEGLPRFLGAEGPRTYFFGAQNPAELRGTGGLLGAFSILQIDDGRFRFSPFLPTHTLDQPPRGSVPPPNESYAAYEQFRRHGLYWTAINVMPDFPSVAQAILAGYEASTGRRLDGVIVADPFALAALLDTTGPVAVPGYDVEVDARNVVAFTTNEAFSLFTDPTRRKRVLGDVARVAFERFVEKPSADENDLVNLLNAAAGRHIQVYSADPAMQEALTSTPVGGTLQPPGAEDDLLSVVVNSAAGSKVDFFQERTLAYDVELNADGSASALFDVTLRNHAPTSGQPRYVIGPFPRKHEYFGPILRTIEAGESVALTTVYCGTDCNPLEAEMGGAAVEAGTGVDLGMRYLRHYYSIPSGEAETLRLAWEDPQAWEGNSSGGVFRMTFVNQVTIRPAALTIRIRPPEGMRIASVSSPLGLEEGTAVYRGEPGSRLDVTVEFRPSLPTRLWRNVVRFLTTPVFDF